MNTIMHITVQYGNAMVGQNYITDIRNTQAIPFAMEVTDARWIQFKILFLKPLHW
jgi:hypothetical protein